MTDILRDVVSYGTGTRARMPGVAVAGKTRTAEDHADAWFCGYTTRVASCVWIGYPESRVPMRSVHGISVTGGSLPAEIWRAFMSNTAGGSSFSEPAPSGASGTSSYSPPPSGAEASPDPADEPRSGGQPPAGGPGAGPSAGGRR